MSSMQRETGTIKKNWAKSVKTALVFPNNYSVAMSSLSFQRLYELINGLSGVLCDRFTLDRGKSIERDFPLSDYDVIIFTVPFIMDAPNVFKIAREINGEKLLCAGGIAVTANRRIFEGYVNIIFPHSIEEHTAVIYKMFELLKMGAKISEVIEHINQAIEQQERLRDLNGIIPPHTVVYTDRTEFSNTHLVEIARGCVGRCRFCLSSHLEGRFKPFQYEYIMKATEGIPQKIHTVGLVGDAVLSHPDIDEIVNSIIQKGKRPAFASIRIQDLNHRNYDLIIKSDIKTLTIAPEVATDRMMEIVNKKYDRDLLLDILKRLISRGLTNLKLYFIIGLPSERMEDIEAMIQFITLTKGLFIESSRKKGFAGRIRVSINNFVPSPFTPFAEHQPDGIERIESRQSFIREKTKGIPNIQVSFMDIFDTLYQTALFRAEREDALPLLSPENPRRAFKADPDFRARIMRLCYKG